MDDDNGNGSMKLDDKVLTIAEQEKVLVESYKKKQSVIGFKYPLNTTSIVVPRVSQTNNTLPERIITMSDNNHPDKVLLYKVIIAAYNYSFFDEFASESAKGVFSSVAHIFVGWLNDHTVNNRYEILKEYESYRFDELNNHGGYSGLVRLKSLFSYALDNSNELHDTLTPQELIYLQDLRQTKVSPNLKRSQKSLASYFGGMDWLRKEDIGIGCDLYMTLASPKLTVKSLSLTASVILIELAKYKKELQDLIKDSELHFPLDSKRALKLLPRHERQNLIGNVAYKLISKYHSLENPSFNLKSALDVFLLSNASSDKAYTTIKPALISQNSCDALFLPNRGAKTNVRSQSCKDYFTADLSGCLFSFEVIMGLDSNEEFFPITDTEQWMFSWLMASLTVQPYDIPKLTHSSFRRVQVGNRVTHIECEYFKGRSKIFHTTRSLSTRSFEGQATLTYLNAQSIGTVLYKHRSISISKGIASLTGSLRLLCSLDGMSSSMENAHNKEELPLIIPIVFSVLISKGITNVNVVPNEHNYPLNIRNELAKKSGTYTSNTLFGLQAIKNSAVHAFSDPYTLHFLINRNSHSNQTEKAHYLNDDNQEWINSAGRITREVMLDLINNVFDLNFDDLNRKEKEKEIARFNSEFMGVTDSVSYKSEEMIARLRVITGQKKGGINEIGVLALSDKDESKELMPIYILDSPLTALKMFNYLHEFKKHYKKLLSFNPDYLYKTVMPTVEWMHVALTRLSKNSQQYGRKQFNEMIINGVEVSVFHSI